MFIITTSHVSLNTCLLSLSINTHTVFYRYKRGKVQEAYKSGIACKDSIIRLVQTTPGLEQGYDETLSSTQLMELSRANIRVVLLNNLAPTDTSKRMHRKCLCLSSLLDWYTSFAHILCSYSIAMFIIGKSHGNSVMSFLEMNKLILIHGRLLIVILVGKRRITCQCQYTTTCYTNYTNCSHLVFIYS